MTTETVGHVVLTFRVHEEDGTYVSVCEELGVTSCGDTIHEAFDNLADAVILYLDTLEEEGERERMFTELGVTVLPGPPPKDGHEVALRARPNEYVSPHAVRIPAGAT